MASKKRKLGDDGNSSHVYQPLLGSDHIRVLVLEPSDDTDSPLCGSFHEASLKDLSGKYEAISYTWGKPILSYPVHTGDGSQVFVTENLDNALRRFRKKKARWLWVDALCINQIDSAEKAVQIPFMADIFRAATRVLAWLGPGTGGEDGIIRSLPRAAKLQEATPAAAIEQLLSLPWFSRVWIVQEIIANAQLMIVCGSSKISWVTFLEAISYCGIDAKEGEVIRPGFAAMRRIIRTWVKRHFPTTNNTTARDGGLLNLMTDFSNFSCSNSRDRIFAIYSLANDTTTGPIELPSRNVSRDSLNPISMVIDYSQSIQETYTRLATALVEAGRGLELLHYASIHKSQIPGWPTWLPDWRTKTGSPLEVIHAGENIGLLHTQRSKVIGYDGTQLKLEYRLQHFLEQECTVKRIGPLLSSPTTTDRETFSQRWQRFCEFMALTHGTVHYSAEDDAVLSVLRVRVMDSQMPFSEPPGATIASAYKKYQRDPTRVANIILIQLIQNLLRLEARNWLGNSYCEELNGRRIFAIQTMRSDSISIGIGPAESQEGDILLLCAEGRRCFLALVLRRVNKTPDTYTLIGNICFNVFAVHYSNTYLLEDGTYLSHWHLQSAGLIHLPADLMHLTVDPSLKQRTITLV